MKTGLPTFVKKLENAPNATRKIKKHVAALQHALGPDSDEEEEMEELKKIKEMKKRKKKEKMEKTKDDPKEIILKKDYLGEFSDIWSIGILMYTTLCGCFPFRGNILFNFSFF